MDIIPDHAHDGIYEQRAHAVYDILVETCSASNETWVRGEFVHTVSGWLRDGVSSEYRFSGELGFGGKLWTERDGYRVSCYPEDSTDERDAMIDAANARLRHLAPLEPANAAT